MLLIKRSLQKAVKVVNGSWWVANRELAGAWLALTISIVLNNVYRIAVSQKNTGCAAKVLS